jgi:O-antigen/teichoic acid export membrane protein
MASGLSTQAAIIWVGRFLNIVVAAGTMMILARRLDQESYGAIAQLLMLYMVFSQIFAVGLPQSTYYFLPRYAGGERRGFIIQTILLLMLSGLLLGLGLYFGSETLGRLLGSARLPGLLRIFAIYPFFMLTTMAVEGTLLNANRPVPTVIFGTLIRVGMFCALVIPTTLGASLEHTLRIWMVVGAVMCVIAIALMLSTVRGLPFIWRRSMLRDEWAFSLPLAGVTLLSLSSTYLSRFLVSNVFGATAFAVYVNATIEIPTVTTVTNAAAAVMTAEFSRRAAVGEMGALLAIWHRATTRLAVILFASFGFLAYWGHETMLMLFSERYADSGIIFSILVWVIPLHLSTTQPLYVALGATRQLVVINVIRVVVMAICVLAGGRLLGLPGMAVGSVTAGYLGVMLSIYVLSCRLTDIGWRNFLPWRRVGMVLLLALACGGISRGLFVLLMQSWPAPASYVTALLVFLLCYTGGLYLLRMHDLLIPAGLLKRFQRTASVTSDQTTV